MHDVAATALRLFERNGYEATTMQQIATAAGISRPTLFRYFGGKSDIVWDRYDDQTVELRELLANADVALSPLDVLAVALPRILNYDAGDLDLLRTQVKIIASVPELRIHSEQRAADRIAIIAEFIADRSGCAPDDLYPLVMSRCVWSAGWSALTSWASGHAQSPADTLAAGFEVLRSGFALPAPTDQPRRPA
ncbi:MAG: TetR family transcriptional regulator [Microbacterium sp.]|uniref:acyl-CoA-like ligand-binding transcription factor n=1 Tax=Microbacterium sp. TaxID=51671 RepID=UPI002603F538|nr:TetR family transcriptional regulator [Microbacterium sp.]MCX6501506.1 TetR family transcriptional regulator [Microbacterium sp.]